MATGATTPHVVRCQIMCCYRPATHAIAWETYAGTYHSNRCEEHIGKAYTGHATLTPIEAPVTPSEQVSE